MLRFFNKFLFGLDGDFGDAINREIRIVLYVAGAGQPAQETSWLQLRERL